MSWIDYQINQDPDLPARSDDVAAEQDAVTNPEETPLPPTQGLGDLADQLLLPLPWLEEVDWLLRDRGAVILTGPPGSGKTFLARALAEHYAPSRHQFLQFHPSYAYEDFVEGYRPTATENDILRYEVVGGPLRDAIRDADGSLDDYAMVIDEINRANLSKVLGELFFALEYRGMPVRPQYSNVPISIPQNLLFIGTMNTADRSIASFDAALRRRFHFVECDPTQAPFKGLLRRYFARQGIDTMNWLADLLIRANERVPDPKFSIGPSHFMRTNITKENAERVWKHSVWPYLTSRFDPEAISDLQWDNLYAVTVGAVTDEAPTPTRTDLRWDNRYDPTAGTVVGEAPVAMEGEADDSDVDELNG